jgi:hypothetical protein
MQNVKKTSKFKLVGHFFLTLFSMLLLFSCSKTMGDMPVQDNPKLSTLNQSTSERIYGGVESVPFYRTLFVTCANSGAGEEVLLTGTVIDVDQVIFNDHGFTLTIHTNPKGITGVGLSTGDKFIASGGSQETITGAFENNQFTGGYIEQLRIVGPTSTFIINYKFHVTVLADGTFTSSISDENVLCRL